jgi:two-component system LytT family sensor kinase
VELAVIEAQSPRWVGRHIGLTVPLLSHRSLFWILQIGGWLAYGLMMGGFTLKAESVRAATYDTILFVLVGILLTLAYRPIFRRWRRRGVSLPLTGVGILVLGIVGVVLMWEPQALAAHLVVTVRPLWVAEMPLYTSIPMDIWYTWCVTLIGWSLLYFGINDGISLQTERRRAAAAEAFAHEARLRTLQAQLQPHFLFNTLNSISALIFDDRAQDAARMIAGLGTLLRTSLQIADSTRIPLERELEFVSQYLEIEKMRYGERLTYRFDVDPAAMNALVPTLLLLPLVENALRHGILPKRSGGIVAVRAQVVAGVLELQIADDGAGWQSNAPESSGIGLANTARRLEELFGDRARLTIDRGKARGVTIDIAFPFETTFGPPAAIA